MTITARIIADSISPQSIRLTTLQCRYPKFIHGEFMTHRVFSRNASSSRAIPVERLIKDVELDPAIPVTWYKNKSGMQETEECTREEQGRLIVEWLAVRTDAVRRARHMTGIGAHKQHINRVLEPWCHINVVVTATEWSNFFALRCHPDAQPEMRQLAEAIWDAMAHSAPLRLQPGEWHLPYVNLADKNEKPVLPSGGTALLNATKLSVARCARVSYLTQEGKKPSVAEDLALYERLVGAVPLHASPCEHQATPDVGYSGRPETKTVWVHPEWHGNFKGWIQFRKTLSGKCQ